ncbi:MAG TPA: hypothetical protein VMW83_12665 [Spirochaetia bacterium]|nr:hypothetical protein [Spirochaetia bacterium]
MGIIYHYTSEVARNDICAKKRIRVSLTSVSCNDVMDTIYIKEIINELRKECKGDNIFIKETYETIYSVLDCEAHESNNFLQSKIFMFCLSNIRDDKNLKKFGDKYIAFDKERLIDSFDNIKNTKDFFGHFECGSVIYDKQQQKKAIDDAIKAQEYDYIRGIDSNFKMINTLIKTVYSTTPTTCHYGNSFLLEFNNGTWVKKLPHTKNNKSQITQSNMWVDLSNRIILLAPFIKRKGEKGEYTDENEFRFSFYRDQNNNSYMPLSEEKYIYLSVNDECIVDSGKVNI